MDTIIQEIKNLKERIRKLERNPNLYFGDWVEIKERATRINNKTFKFANENVEPKEIFAKGDILRWGAGSGWGYGVIIDFNNSGGVVIAGDVLANNLDKLAKATALNPVGFPGWFYYDPEFSPNYTGAQDVNIFMLTGSIVTVSMRLVGVLSSGLSFSFKLPIPCAYFSYPVNVSFVPWFMGGVDYIDAGGNPTTVTCFIKLEITGVSGDVTATIQPINSNDMIPSNQSKTLNFSFTFTYFT